MMYNIKIIIKHKYMRKIFPMVLVLFALPMAVGAVSDASSSAPYRLKKEIKGVVRDVRQEARDLRGATTKAIKEKARDIREEARDLRATTTIPLGGFAKYQGIRDLRATTTQEIKELRSGAIEAIQQKREEVRQAIERAREEFKKTIEQKRVEVKDKIKAKKDELKLELKKIKDERKKQVVEKIDTQLDSLNERWVDHFNRTLGQIEIVLGRITVNADELSGKGKDATSVFAAIESAKSAIASSRLAVGTQAGKTYTIIVNQEGTLKQDVGATRKALRADLEGVQATVKVARDAAHQAAVALGQINKVDLDDEATATSTTSTTTQN